MSKETQRNIRLGIFVLAGLLVFIAGIYLLGSKQSLFGATIKVRAVFYTVNGLQPGNNVRYLGTDVGAVESVTTLNDTSVEVIMRIRKNLAVNIRKNSVATIGTDGLVGSMLVNLSPGSGGSEAMIQDGDQVRTLRPVDTENILRTFKVTNDNAAYISTELARVFQNIRAGRGPISVMLNDTILAANLRRTIDNSNAISERAMTITRDLQIISSRMTRKGSVATFLGDTSVSRNFNTTIADLNRTGKQALKASNELEQFTQKLNKNQGLVGRLLDDTALASEFVHTMENARISAERLNSNMEAMQHNILFRGYFRKMEKREEKRRRGRK